MAFSRALSVISIISVSWFAAVGCGDDDSITLQPGASGEGGEAGEGAGGTSLGGTTAGGTTNAGAGNGGTSSAGESGNGTGGTAGDAGAGVGGQPVVGGAGGEPPVTPVGGAAGEGGAGGEGPGSLTLKLCSNECEVDDDCAQDGVIDQLICDETSKRCVPSVSVACTAADDCFPGVNGWTPCASIDDCEDSESFACITWQGKGHCAYRAGSEGECFLPGEAAQTLNEFGKVDSPVAVCIVPGGCRLGECVPGCEANGCEGSGFGNTCGTTTHLCECAADADCTASNICGTDNLCAECKTSTDCPGGALSGKDTCVNGRCGCSSAAVCPDLTEAGTPVCE